MKKDNIPELGKKEKGVSGTLQWRFMRNQVEGKTEAEITQEIGAFMMDACNHLFTLVMKKKAEWEAETEKERKFMGGVH